MSTGLRGTGEEPERCLSEAARLMGEGLPGKLAATAVGRDVSTLRRWARRARGDETLARHRGPWHEPGSREVARARRLVHELHGLVGAASLSHSVPGLSRRQAAQVKAETCTELERARKGRLERITITQAGVLRGFDVMRLNRRHLMVAGDGSIPYRTSWAIEPRYDGPAVARFLNQDFHRHGAPLVLRVDRARQHTTELVRRVLLGYGVLGLQGPAYRASYYGQLERQNEEHRQWLSHAPAHGAPAAEVATMMEALNGKWRRRELGWRTAKEVWRKRPRRTLDRRTFRQEVERRAARIREETPLRGKPADYPERLAIEQILARRRLLVRKRGGWC